jgi:hypothetical protein
MLDHFRIERLVMSSDAQSGVHAEARSWSTAARTGSGLAFRGKRQDLTPEEPRDAKQCVSEMPRLIVGGIGVSSTAILANAHYGKYRVDELRADSGLRKVTHRPSRELRRRVTRRDCCEGFGDLADFDFEVVQGRVRYIGDTYERLVSRVRRHVDPRAM